MNKHTIYNNKYRREDIILSENQKISSASEKKVSKSSDNPKDNISLSIQLKYYLNKYKNPLIIVAIIIIVSCILVGILIPLLSGKKGENDAIKTIFSPAFKINSKEGTLTQYSFKSIQSYETTTEGEAAPYIIFTKSI